MVPELDSGEVPEPESPSGVARPESEVAPGPESWQAPELEPQPEERAGVAPAAEGLEPEPASGPQPPREEGRR